CSCLRCSRLSLSASSPPHIYTLSLHDALPILLRRGNDDAVRRADRRLELHHSGGVAFSLDVGVVKGQFADLDRRNGHAAERKLRSEEHTSELQSLRHLVCRLLLEKKKKNTRPSADEQTTEVLVYGFLWLHFCST